MDPSVQGQVEFRDVTFRYSKNSEAVVEHVTFKAEAGQTVAFIGSTGSGKSIWSTYYLVFTMYPREKF